MNTNANHAEKAVIASILLDDMALDHVLPISPPHHFRSKVNRTLMEVIVDMREAGRPVDPSTLSQELMTRDLYDRLGGADYIHECFETQATAANCEYFAKIVRDAFLINNLEAQCRKAIQATKDTSGQTAKEILDKAEQIISKAFHTIQSEDAKSFREITTGVLEDMAKARDGKDNALLTGFTNLDDLTGGLNPGEFAILAARPSMGKTTFMSNMASQMAKAGHKVLIFSLEMSPEQIVKNILCGQAQVYQSKLKTGRLTDHDLKKISSEAASVADLPIWVDGSASLSILELKSKARQYQMRFGVDVVMIDYLQLIDGPGENRQQEVSFISRQLKVLARELRVPVLSLSQLSRSVEKRDDKRPRLSDLRESGAIEQDADLAMFLYRDSYYQRDNDAGQDDKSATECIVAKHRNGPTGTLYFNFEAKKLRFTRGFGK